MKVRALLPFAVLSAALAQGPRGPMGPMGPLQPQFTELKAHLNLSDTQIQQIQQAQRQAMESARTTMPQIADKEKALRDLLDKGTTDAAAVGKLVLEIEALRKQARQVRETAHQAALALLSADQKTKLKALEDAAKLQPVIHQAQALALLAPLDPGIGPGMRMGMGPGMGMGMGPGMGFRGRMER